MKLTEALLDPESLSIAAAAYRLRPTTVEGLRQLLDPEPADFDRQLTALRKAGFLTIDRDGGLRLASPHAVFAALSRARLDNLVAETGRTVAMMEALPRLIRMWHLGEAVPGEAHPLAAELIHGADRIGHWWLQHLALDTPGHPCLVVPDLEMLDQLLSAGTDIVNETVFPRVITTRVIVTPEQATTPLFERLTARADDFALQFRVLDDPPSAFYVDEQKLAALPEDWGELRLSKLLIVRTPPIIAALVGTFEDLWRRAAPVHSRPKGWEPILGLLGQGLTDEAIASILGQNTRTIRRRIAEAMLELNAGSRFELGAAWARRTP